MANFNRDNRFSERRAFGKREFGRRGSDRPMYKTTCARCGNECEVPFKPSGDRPVLCSKCFEDNGGSDSRRYGRMNFQRTNFGDRRMFEAICDKCGNKCSVPFQPTSGKPVFCSRCFEEKNSRVTRPAENYKEQFTALNSKLDKILRILEPVIVSDEIQKITQPKKQTNNTKKKKTIVKKTTSTQKE